MMCARVRRRLSEWIDGDLDPGLAGKVAAHLSLCAECARRAGELRAVGRLLARLPRPESQESVAAHVLERVDMESEARRPALVSLFRGFSAARPLMLPSLVPATLVLVTVLAAVLAFDSGPLPEVHLAPGAWHATPASGTENNPLFLSAGVDLPRERTSVELPDEVVTRRGSGTLFLEQVIGRDGSVADVTVIDGDAVGQQALVDALRRQRFEPVRFRGRPVAVSLYRLISRVEVRSPLT